MARLTFFQRRRFPFYHSEHGRPREALICMIIKYITENYIMLFELLGLIIMLQISAHIPARMKRNTFAVIIIIFITSIAYNVELWTQSFETLSPARPLLTAFIYSIYPLPLICIMQLTSETRFSKTKLLLLLIPEIISVPVFFTSQYTHLVFWFTGSNSYQGSNLSNWPYFLFAFYLAVFLISNIIYFKSYSKMSRAIPAYIIIGSTLGVILFVVSGSTGDYTALFTSSLLLYYLCIYIHMAKIDPLTSLLNRQSYYQDIKAYHKEITGVISVDMNDLKLLNDEKGHEAGDKALATVSSVLSKNCCKNSTVYRIGGDEFIILCVGPNPSEIGKSISDIRAELTQTPYTCALGYSVKTPEKTVDDLIREADEKMYENKAFIKGKRGFVPR